MWIDGSLDWLQKFVHSILDCTSHQEPMHEGSSARKQIIWKVSDLHRTFYIVDEKAKIQLYGMENTIRCPAFSMFAIIMKKYFAEFHFVKPGYLNIESP